MKNKTIANWLIASFLLCVAGTVSGASEVFFMFGGLGLLVFTVIAVVRLYNINKSHWLAYALGIDTGLFAITSFLGESESAIAGVMVILYWVFGIWAIVRLYQTKDSN